MDQNFIPQKVERGPEQPSDMVPQEKSVAIRTGGAQTVIAHTFQGSAQDFSVLDTNYDCDLKSARQIKKFIPSYDKAELPIKEYFEKVVKLSCETQLQIINCQPLKKEAEDCFSTILGSLSSILRLILKYAQRRYQQKFKIEMFQCDFERIRKTTEELEAIRKKIDEITKRLDSDCIQIVVPATVQEISDDNINQGLGLSKPEDVLNQKIESFFKEEADLICNSEKLEVDKSQFEIKIEGLNQKIASFENAKESNNKLLNNINNKLVKISTSKNNIKEQTNKILEKNLEDQKKDNQGRKTEIFKFYNEKMAEIEEKRSELNSKLIESTTINPSSHYIFVVDHSGSMLGSKIEATQKALNAFVESNKAQISSDRISVIVFEDKAHEHMKNCKFSEFLPLKNYPWGGTNFDKAFELTQDIAFLAKNLRPVVVFLTDGDGVMTKTESILTEMNIKHRHQGLLFFSIGVGTDFNVENLKKITKYANNGNIFIDIGNERIELLQTIKDENLLEKIFLEISTSLNLYSLKIKANIDMLDAEKIKLTKEAKEKKDFHDNISEEEYNNFEKKYNELLDRKFHALEEDERECLEKLALFQEQENKIETAIDSCRSEIGNHTVEIAKLKKDISIKKEEQEIKVKERQNLQIQKDALMQGRKDSCLKLVNQQNTMGFSSLLQATEYFASFERLTNSVVYRSHALHNFKSFIKFIHAEASQIEDKLTSIQSDIQDLNGYAMLSNIYKYFDGIEFEKENDSQNVKKIVYYLFEIKETDTEQKNSIDELLIALHPRDMFDPEMSEDDRRKKIELRAKALYKQKKENIDAEIKKREKQKAQIDENKMQNGNQKKRAEEELKTKKEEIRSLTKEIRTLDRSKNEDDEDELLELRTQLETLAGEKNEIEAKLAQLKAKMLHQDEIADTIDLENMQDGKKVREITDEADRMCQNLLDYYIRLKAELMPKIMREVDDSRVHQLEHFYRTMKDGILNDLNGYVERNGKGIMRRDVPALREITNRA